MVAAVCMSAVAAFAASSTSSSGGSSGQKNTDGTCSKSEAGLTYPRQEGTLLLHNFVSTSSTQDEARNLVETSEIPEDVTTIVVTADEQTNGRGTSGRKWIGAKGNTFVTICIRQSAWIDTNLSMTLLPIRIGVIMAERIDALLQTFHQKSRQPQSPTGRTTVSTIHQSPMTTIKWPNDVLVDEKKISGVLIESSSNSWFLIGIGVNVAHAPTVPPPGRPSTSIGFYYPEILMDDGDSTTSIEERQVLLARELGEGMASDLSLWLSDQKGANPNQSVAERTRILQSWKQWVNWDMQLVWRDTEDHETVTPVDIESDGQLRVRGSQGRERLVVTDYFV